VVSEPAPGVVQVTEHNEDAVDAKQIKRRVTKSLYMLKWINTSYIIHGRVC
jgi:hypothetical protein